MVAIRLAVRLDGEIDQGEAEAAARAHAFRLVTDVTRQTLNRTIVLTPVRTGNLRGHNQMGVIEVTGGTVRGEVFNDANYAEAVHDGTRPHKIVAKRRRATGPSPGGGTRRTRGRGALRFEYRGRIVYVRSVNHPGTRARPWMARAGEEVAAKTGFTWERLAG